MENSRTAFTNLLENWNFPLRESMLSTALAVQQKRMPFLRDSASISASLYLTPFFQTRPFRSLLGFWGMKSGIIKKGIRSLEPPRAFLNSVLCSLYFRFF